METIQNKTRYRILNIALMFGVIALIGIAHVSNAQTIRTARAGYWNVGNTWQGGNVPGAGAAVQIRHNVTLNSNQTCASLSINSGVSLSSDNVTYCTLTVNGNFSGNGGFNAEDRISVVLGAGGTTRTLTGPTFYNLTINGGYQLQASADITGTLTISGTGSLTSNATTYTLDFQQPGTPVVNNGTLNLTCTGLYSSTSNQDVAGGTYGYLELSGSGSSKQAVDDITVTNTLTIDNGVTLRGGNNTINLGGATPFVVNGTFAYETSTVNYNRNGSQTVALVDYYNLETGGTSGTKTANGPLTVYGNVRMARELAMGANTINIQGDLESLGTGNLSGIGSTVRFFGSGHSDVIPHNLTMHDVYNLEIAKSSIYDTVYVHLIYNGTSHLALGVHADGDLTISSGVFDLGEVYLYIVGGTTMTGTFTISDGAIFRTAFQESLPYYSGWNGTTPRNYANYSIANNSIWELYGNSMGIRGVGHSIPNYGNLLLQGAGNHYLMSNVNIATSLTRTSPASLVNGAYTLSYSSGATLKYVVSDSTGAGYRVPQTTTSNEFPSLNGPANLYLNNIQGVSLHADRNITGNLQMFAGKFFLGSSTFVLGASSNLYGAGPGTYIVTDGYGMLGKANVGSTPFTWPIGPDSSSYNPATVANNGIVDTYAARVQPYLSIQPNDTSRVVHRQWTFVELSPGGGSNNITLQWDAASEASLFSHSEAILMDRSSSGSWGNYVTASVSGSGTYTASASGFNELSDFMITNNSYLPVCLVSLSGAYRNGAVRLQWETASELNNTGFEVYRRKPGSEWKQIGFVEGNGTTNEPETYVWEDKLDGEQILSSVYEYKLRQIDLDGSSDETGAIQVFTVSSSTAMDAYVYPSPFRESAQLTFSLESDARVSIRLFDAAGTLKKVLAAGEALQQGSYSLRIDRTGLQPGAYFCVIDTGSGQKIAKFTIAR